jgi:hypothetical protein
MSFMAGIRIAWGLSRGAWIRAEKGNYQRVTLRVECVLLVVIGFLFLSDDACAQS